MIPLIVISTSIFSPLTNISNSSHQGVPVDNPDGCLSRLLRATIYDLIRFLLSPRNRGKGW